MSKDSSADQGTKDANAGKGMANTNGWSDTDKKAYEAAWNQANDGKK